MLLSEEERILLQEAGVKAYESESPPTFGLKAGAFADVGTLILTNRRLVYVMKGGADRAAAWALGGALVASAVEKRVSKAEVDDLMRYEGSYCIPLQAITHVATARKSGSGYLRVDSNVSGQKPSHSYIFGGGWSKNEDWVNAINSAKAFAGAAQTTAPSCGSLQAQQPVQGQVRCPRCGTLSSSQMKFCGSCGLSFGTGAVGNDLPPPPPSASSAPACPYCSGPLTYIQQYQRWYCYRDQKYV